MVENAPIKKEFSKFLNISEISFIIISTNSVEYSYGENKSESLDFTCKDTAWFLSNIFNATASEYLEIKIEKETQDNLITELVNESFANDE
jgi:hypothetical protein